MKVNRIACSDKSKQNAPPNPPPPHSSLYLKGPTDLSAPCFVIHAQSFTYLIHSRAAALKVWKMKTTNLPQEPTKHYLPSTRNW